MHELRHYLLRSLTIAASLAVSGAAFSQGGAGTADQIIVSGSVFYVSDASQRDGKDLPGGTTTYLSVAGQYNVPKYFAGIGLIYQKNDTGETQSETAVGLKLELFYYEWPFYLEFVPFSVLHQEFANRSIESRDGNMTLFGLGVRADLFSWLFFDGSFKIRTSTYKKEDGVEMPEPIVRTEKMPYLGLGLKFPI